MLPPPLIWTLGAVGAAIITKLVVREWQRVNAELDRARTVPVNEPDAVPKLRRDPTTGVYRP